MIVPDVDLLVYAYNTGAPRHADARHWWEGLVNGVEIVGIPLGGIHRVHQIVGQSQNSSCALVAGSGG